MIYLHTQLNAARHAVSVAWEKAVPNANLSLTAASEQIEYSTYINVYMRKHMQHHI